MNKYFLYSLLIFFGINFTSCEEAKTEEKSSETVELAKQFQIVDELLNHIQSGKIEVKVTSIEEISSLFDGVESEGVFRSGKDYDGFRFSSTFEFKGDKLEKIFYDFIFADTADARINEDYQVLLNNLSSMYSEPTDSYNGNTMTAFFWDQNQFELALEHFNNGYTISVIANKGSMEINEVTQEVELLITNIKTNYQLGSSTKDEIQKLHSLEEEGDNLSQEKDFGSLRCVNTFSFNSDGTLAMVENNFFFNQASVIRSNTDMNSIYNIVYTIFGEPDISNSFDDGNSYLWITENGEIELNGYDDGYGFVYKPVEEEI